MAIKRSLDKLETGVPLGDLIEQAREKMQLRLLDVTAAHGLSVEALPFHHEDPFDRLGRRQSVRCLRRQAGVVIAGTMAAPLPPRPDDTPPFAATAKPSWYAAMGSPAS
jgi:hypothetical protein